jgi:hypothetical protein
MKKIEVKPKLTEPNTEPPNKPLNTLSENEKQPIFSTIKHNKRKIVTKKIVELAESSVIHGLPRIFKSENLITRLLWLICFLLAIAACAYMTFLSIADFLQYDVISKTQIITEYKVAFPSVTICNANPLTTEYSERLMFAFAKNTTHNFSSSGDQYLNDLDKFNRLFLLYAYNETFGDDSRAQLGFDLEDMLLNCFFDEQLCYETDFKWGYDLNLGNCYTFNSGLNSSSDKPEPLLRESNKAGSKYGLVLHLFLDTATNKLSSSFVEGLKIFVHNSSSDPNFAEGISVSPGKSTEIGMRRTFVSKEPLPYSDCLDLSHFESEFYKAIAQTNKTYRQADCFDLCLQQDIIDKCLCYDLSYLNLDDEDPCLNETQIACADGVYEAVSNFEGSSKFDTEAECLKKCPLECESVKYDYMISSLNFPTYYIYDTYRSSNETITSKKNMSYEYFEKRALAVSVFYTDLSYTRFSESPKISIISLLSGVGGTLGLFAGISFLSLVEVVEIVVEVFIVVFR